MLQMQKTLVEKEEELTTFSLTESIYICTWTISHSKEIYKSRIITR